jgi:hypothetical protein
MVFLKEKQCIFLSLEFGNFAKKVIFHPYENTECYAVYRSIGDSILIEKQGASLS